MLNPLPLTSCKISSIFVSFLIVMASNSSWFLWSVNEMSSWLRLWLRIFVTHWKIENELTITTVVDYKANSVDNQEPNRWKSYAKNGDCHASVAIRPRHLDPNFQFLIELRVLSSKFKLQTSTIDWKLRVQIAETERAILRLSRFSWSLESLSIFCKIFEDTFWH